MEVTDGPVSEMKKLIGRMLDVFPGEKAWVLLELIWDTTSLIRVEIDIALILFALQDSLPRVKSNQIYNTFFGNKIHNSTFTIKTTAFNEGK